MSEQNAPTEGAEVTTTAETPGDPAEAALGDAGKKALRAEREAREAAERALKEFKTQVENERLTDLERAQKQAQEYQEAAARAATEALRWRTAAKFGISDEDAETFLTATDEAGITRQAERLAAFKQQSTPAGPRPDLSQGSRGEPLALNSDGLEQALRDKLGIG